ncbi:hypothetical protein GO003_024825 [Methylicorpusculum oleiharenae]|uniref:hypothetical protein n=1 Tax=Methylicorpusculum oleiharenae TaxID=1338687 RepID=UPI00135BE8B9|nr:hypothetical protein [Methylicorpusculum oleiharenae]MCD2453606.1 hypothetical protein [Methylicorpusculum oleiharenae]
MKVFPDYLPSDFGILLLTLALIVSIAPYAAGHDYGNIKIPEFSERARTRLKWFGPVLLLLVLFLHLPVIQKECDEPVYEFVTDKELCGTKREEYVVTPATPKTCRNEAFGRQGWKYNQEVTGSSGWMAGGQGQPDWCNRMIGTFISSRNIGPEHEAGVVRSSENARWTGPISRSREYNYFCTIKVSWEPIVAEKSDAKVCGMNPAVLEVREVATSCRRKTGTKKVKCDA